MKRKSPPSFVKEYACVGKKGKRHTYEDAHCTIEDIRTTVEIKEIKKDSKLGESTPASFFGIFDGHGGARAAVSASERVPQLLLKELEEKGRDGKAVKLAFESSFSKFDEEYIAKAKSQSPPWRDGSTAACVLLLDDQVFVAGIGDARAVLCRRDKAKPSEDKTGFFALPLSEDHNALKPKERERIEKSGGRIEANGRINGVLEVSRAFGDFELKKYGVISRPDLRKFAAGPNDEFIIVACDGLWKDMSNKEAVQMARRLLMAGQSAKAVANVGNHSK
mmetsp:Transcript_17215/g.42910  ORF Transcript_17215/g.42910 Transcript_17215/m.42910 type:complete len:278 (-) Transcript_17215:280-1113(-)